MELNEKPFKSKCPTCGKDKFYKSEHNMLICIGRNCRSCTNSISQGGKGNVHPKNGKKSCIDCGKSKDISEFNKRHDKELTLHSVCKECANARSSTYHTTFYRYKKYGIGKSDFDQLSKSQDHKCKICKEEVPLIVDHDHNTGVIRGLLCKKCNSALGLLQENTIILENALNYLKENYVTIK